MTLIRRHTSPRYIVRIYRDERGDRYATGPLIDTLTDDLEHARRIASAIRGDVIDTWDGYVWCPAVGWYPPMGDHTDPVPE